ncbi:MFS family permease [Actinoplanes lutulentus]|uniref:MFS transporter n=1 Tax=Actinoplanes lutulentus TaxID=1287878 RepID=A0A327Z302_9ACTN|nr:MFS transporter [Actinoplanes lutulentus]MBB2943339.1 MFS family permease [Actinoplanes lutulentus]RAK28398.1 MFS transporter [Actinoplanes lutulentus]
MSTELPEPRALDDPPVPDTTVRSRVSQRRLGTGLFLIGFGWLFANSAFVGVLAAAKIAVLEPDDKVFYLGAGTALSAVATTIALFAWGAISDLTRSRWGRRTPWIVFGAATGAGFLLLVPLTQTISSFFAVWIGYSLFFNALPAAVLAVFPDRIPTDKRGTASAIYGGAQVFAGAAGSIAASRFISDPDALFPILAAVMLTLPLSFVFLAPDYPSTDQPRTKLDLRGLADTFRFPTGAPDFYWAFAGRFLLLLGLYMVQNFMLYLLTDYIGLTDSQAGDTVAIAGAASLITIVIGTVVAGPVSDRIGRRKMPIFISSMLFGLAVALPLFWPTPTSMIIFSAVSGLGLGAFLSVDAALMTEVLPSQNARGKDLGILNTANTVPAVLAPLITSSIISAGLGYRPVFILSLTIIIIGAVSIFKIKSVR